MFGFASMHLRFTTDTGYGQFYAQEDYLGLGDIGGVAWKPIANSAAQGVDARTVVISLELGSPPTPVGADLTTWNGAALYDDASQLIPSWVDFPITS